MRSFDLNRVTALASIALCSALFADIAVAAPSYQFVDLTPSGYVDASASNDTVGQQVGSAFATTGSNYHAMLWNSTAQSFVDLNPGTLNTSNGTFTTSFAYGTNGSVQVGSGRSPSATGAGHALLWHGSASSYVDLNPAGYSSSEASDLAGGQQVGYGLSTTAQQYHALMWQGSASSAVDLNPAGWVQTMAEATTGATQVGQGILTGGDGVRPVLWHGSAASAIDLTPIGFDRGAANDATDTEQVGWARTTSGLQIHALLWHGAPDNFVDIHPAGGYTYSIALSTNGMQEVGYISGGPLGSSFHAALWNGSAQGWVDLQAFVTGGFTNSYAYGISADGTIVGSADIGGIQRRAVMWVPVPEPTSTGLVAIVLMLAPRIRRARPYAPPQNTGVT